MRDYEVTVIIQPELEDEQRKELIGQIGDLLLPGQEGDDQVSFDHWGRRQLAYPIRKYTDGYYVFYDGLLDPERVRDIERSMQYMEDVLRYLVIRKPE